MKINYAWQPFIKVKNFLFTFGILFLLGCEKEDSLRNQTIIFNGYLIDESTSVPISNGVVFVSPNICSNFMCTSGSSIGSATTNESGYFEIKAQNKNYSSFDFYGSVPEHLRDLFSDSGSFYLPWANPKAINYIRLKRITNLKLKLTLDNLRFDTLDLYLGYPGSNFSIHKRLPCSVRDTLLNYRLWDASNDYVLSYYTKTKLKDSTCMAFSYLKISAYQDTLKKSISVYNKDFGCFKR